MNETKQNHQPSVGGKSVCSASGHIRTPPSPRQDVITRPPLRRCSGQLARARSELARVLIAEPVFWSGGAEGAGPHASFFIHYVLVLPSAPAWSMLSVQAQLISEACNTSPKYTAKTYFISYWHHRPTYRQSQLMLFRAVQLFIAAGITNI
jgi:hypothetical protein